MDTEIDATALALDRVDVAFRGRSREALYRAALEARDTLRALDQASSRLGVTEGDRELLDVIHRRGHQILRLELSDLEPVLATRFARLLPPVLRPEILDGIPRIALAHVLREVTRVLTACCRVT